MLFSGCGGASEGYRQAGFDVVDVDNNPGLLNPHGYIVADAMEIAAEPWLLDGFDAVHASPPCQLWCAGFSVYRHTYPDLITPLRPLLERSGKPWVIENVPRAPLVEPVLICGGALGCVTETLQLHRHRHFESNFTLLGAACAKVRPFTVSVVGNGTPSGNRKTIGRNPTIAEKREVMGIPWARRNELSQAIPPAYTRHIGLQLLEQLS